MLSGTVKCGLPLRLRISPNVKSQPIPELLNVGTPISEKRCAELCERERINPFKPVKVFLGGLNNNILDRELKNVITWVAEIGDGRDNFCMINREKSREKDKLMNAVFTAARRKLLKMYMNLSENKHGLE